MPDTDTAAPQVQPANPGDLACPWCGGTLAIVTEDRTREDPTHPVGLECDGRHPEHPLGRSYGCGAQWHTDGTVQTPGRPA